MNRFYTPLPWDEKEKRVSLYTPLPRAILRYMARLEKEWQQEEWQQEEFDRISKEAAAELADDRLLLDPGLPEAVKFEARLRVAARYYAPVARRILADPDSDPEDRAMAQRFLAAGCKFTPKEHL